jgi:hypothetical protein
MRLANFCDPIAIFNSAIPCVDIKFMPRRWIKMLSPIEEQKKRQQRWR